MKTSDFVFVRMTEAAVAAAGDAKVLSVANAQYDYQFTAGVAQRVARYEWDLFLSSRELNQQRLFELTTDPKTTESESK